MKVGRPLGKLLPRYLSKITLVGQSCKLQSAEKLLFQVVFSNQMYKLLANIETMKKLRQSLAPRQRETH